MSALLRRSALRIPHAIRDLHFSFRAVAATDSGAFGPNVSLALAIWLSEGAGSRSIGDGPKFSAVGGFTRAVAVVTAGRVGQFVEGRFAGLRVCELRIPLPGGARPAAMLLIFRVGFLLCSV